MTPEQWVLAIGGLATVLTAGGALLRVQHDRRAGVSGNEREAKRDERADWATFAAEYRQALEDERRRGTEQLARIDELEARLEEKSRLIRAQGDHIDVLEHHIWRGYGPPPPPRPAGL